MLCPSCGHDNLEGMDRCENCMKSLRDMDVPRADATGGLVRSVMEDNLSSLARMETIAARPDEPALEVARRMRDAETGCALVLDDAGKLAGIFTEHDVLRKLICIEGEARERVPVSELMSGNPEALRETDTVAAALNKMAMGRYRHVPIAANDGSYSVASIKSVLKYIAQEEW
ncbi:MAG TPA: CBS domain-containing protein [Pyrinomonadaceae bacterium]|nr:CBS domain-containing protein [Pyrinomonadaceae bacterium]